MYEQPQSNPQPANAQQPLTSSQNEKVIIYIPPAEVFEFWYNRFRAKHPDERPPLAWLSIRSHLPVSTCDWYRKRYEAIFPDAYAIAMRGKHLRLERRRLRYKKRVKPQSS